MKHILITGATGLVGTQLIKALKLKGHEITVLSRSPEKSKDLRSYHWNVEKQIIDPRCLEGVDTIVHLAGENIAGRPWTAKQKKVIIESRVKSTRLLHKAIKEQKADIKDFISASAVGYYGDSGDEILTENSENGYGFLAECCKLWEEEVNHGKNLGMRIAKIRTGFVLSKKGGGLSALAKPISFFVGAPLGSGQQWVPWIHIEDLVNIYIHAIDHPTIMGSYNACAPFPVSNETLTRAVAKKLHRPCWPIHIPEKMLNLILGEMSSVALMSTNTSAQKILETGFMFKFNQLNEALNDIYRHR